MKTEIFKIWACGCYERKCYIKIQEKIYPVHISEEDYQYLKKTGVPTAQSLRRKKRK